MWWQRSWRGGFGVYGAASHTVEELDTELDWIDEHSGGNPYGVDVLLPARSADTGTLDPRKLRDELAALIPEEHRKFVVSIRKSRELACEQSAWRSRRPRR